MSTVIYESIYIKFKRVNKVLYWHEKGFLLLSTVVSYEIVYIHILIFIILFKK